MGNAPSSQDLHRQADDIDTLPPKVRSVSEICMQALTADLSHGHQRVCIVDKDVVVVWFDAATDTPRFRLLENMCGALEGTTLPVFAADEDVLLACKNARSSHLFELLRAVQVTLQAGGKLQIVGDTRTLFNEC